MRVSITPPVDRIEAMQAAMQAKTGERVPIATAEAVLDEFERLVGPGATTRGYDFSGFKSAWVYLPPPTPDDQTGAEVLARARFG